LYLPQNERSTAVLAMIDPKMLEITYTNCGHPPMVLSNGKEVRTLSGVGEVLGNPDCFHNEWECKTASFSEDEAILIYSDGIAPVDSTPSRWIQSMKRKLKSTPQSFPLLVAEQIRENRKAFKTRHESEDDITAIILNYVGEKVEISEVDQEETTEQETTETPTLRIQDLPNAS
jgi:serine phosphatase RsbU (regulator of sigma subunit)